MQVGTNLGDTIVYGLKWPLRKLADKKNLRHATWGRNMSYGLSVPTKRTYGSDVIYGEPDKLIPVTPEYVKRFERRLNRLPEAERNKIIDDWGKTLKSELTNVEHTYGTTNPDVQERVKALRAKSTRVAERYRAGKKARIIKNSIEIPNSEFAALQRAATARKRQKDTMQALRVPNPVVNLELPSTDYALTPTEEDTVYFAALCAFQAYNTKVELENEFNGRKLPELTNIIEIMDTTRIPMATKEGFVAFCPDRNQIVVAFKGTSNMQDVLTDANTITMTNLSSVNGEPLPVPLSGHGGFINRFLNIGGDVLTYINDFYEVSDDKDFEAMMDENDRAKKDLSVLITGHSLGGALATVAAFVIGQLIPDLKIRLVTFESPRVFNLRTLEALQANARTNEIEQHAIRISVRGDLVPTVPPQIWGTSEGDGFRHVGKSYYIQEGEGGIWNMLTGRSSGIKHQMGNVLRNLDRYFSLPNKIEKYKYMPLTNGRGEIGGSATKKRKHPFLKKGSKEAKLYMARLRAMRKK